MRTRSIHHQEGAAAVEFAILTPLIFMILFGMMSTGLAWNSKQTLTHAVREGARYGATLPLETDMKVWLVGVANHAENALQPDVSLSTEGATICVAYVGDSIHSLTRTSDGDTFASAQCPPKEDGQNEPRVQVYVSRIENLIAPGVPEEFLSPKLQSRAVARHELSNTDE